MPKKKKRGAPGSQQKQNRPKPKSQFEKLIQSKVQKTQKKLEKRKALLPKKLNIKAKNAVKITNKPSMPSFLRKKKKRDLFTLGSSDEEFGFTHNGRLIEDMDGTEINEYRGLEDLGDLEKSGYVNPDIVSKLNFAGFEEDQKDGKDALECLFI